MLKARAIASAPGTPCEEALFGLHYTPEELGADVDEDGVVAAELPMDGQEHPAARSGRRRRMMTRGMSGPTRTPRRGPRRASSRPPP